ncbi:MAG: hypothetical protein ACKVOK_01365 [Flavobacteriales bacterium]
MIDWIQICVVVLLCICGMFLNGILKGIADRIQTDPNYRVYDGKNKWQQDEHGNIVRFDEGMGHWYYLGIYMTENNFVERSFMSSTVLVAFTDRWHKVNWFRHRVEDIQMTVIVCLIFGWWVWWTAFLWWIPRGIGFLKGHRGCPMKKAAQVKD